MAYKNLSDYICINCFIGEKTIPLWDQWKSRLWHLRSSRNLLLCDNISFHWQEHAQFCFLCTEMPAYLASWRKIPLGWWFKVTPTLLYRTSVVSAKKKWFPRTQHGSPSARPTAKNIPMLIRNRCCCLLYYVEPLICMGWQECLHFGPSLLVFLQNHSLQCNGICTRVIFRCLHSTYISCLSCEKNQN